MPMRSPEPSYSEWTADLVFATDNAGFSQWADQFPDDYVPLIYDLVMDSWPSVKKGDGFKEVPITRDLCHQLRQHKNRSRHQFRIELESTELVATGEETGRIDLKFSHGYDEYVYFSIECKRLRVVRKDRAIAAMASEYVKEGMFRHFNGQYAVGLNKGGMLGYVMDGDVPRAKENVTKAIHSFRTKLMIAHSAPAEESRIFPKDARMFDTSHAHPQGQLFLIHHLLLPMQ